VKAEPPKLGTMSLAEIFELTKGKPLKRWVCPDCGEFGPFGHDECTY
jgi:hypothetical protein